MYCKEDLDILTSITSLLTDTISKEEYECLCLRSRYPGRLGSESTLVRTGKRHSRVGPISSTPFHQQE